ncbi:MAG: hypothetical protein AAF821_24440 [Cyanobacteria bacterium P01_D01_bin.156]
MNASAQALSISLTRKIANVAVMFRAEFPSAIPDLSPWLTDDFSHQEMKPESIDLSFTSLKPSGLLDCRCILVQILFSEPLLQPGCRLVGIAASGHDHQGQCWNLSSAKSEWQFAGIHAPQDLHQRERFVHLLQQILNLFNYPTALSQSILD